MGSCKLVIDSGTWELPRSCLEIRVGVLVDTRPRCLVEGYPELNLLQAVAGQVSCRSLCLLDVHGFDVLFICMCLYLLKQSCLRSWPRGLASNGQ